MPKFPSFQMPKFPETWALGNLHTWDWELRLGPTARQNFTLRSIVQLLWVNVRLILTLKVDVIYVKSAHNQLKKWLILKFEFPALDCDWSIQIFDFRYLMAFKNNQSFLISFLYCIDLIILSQRPLNKDIDMIKVNNIN